MTLLNLCYIAFRVVDVIDIILVAFLLYGLYRLLKGTAAINIFFGIIAIFILWKVVESFQMKMLSEILGAFISVGFIALIVVFQPEIRTFLLMIGKPIGDRQKGRTRFFNRFGKKETLDYDVIVRSVFRLAQSRTGAIIIITRENNLLNVVDTGERIDADLSGRLLENLFFKNSPLHDGAIVVTKNKIVAAACILPISKNTDLPSEYGLRHRSAIGLTEQTDSVAVIVSEQRGTVSLSIEGRIFDDISSIELSKQINELFMIEE
ncbi:diadenylate cyclase CdaA [Bacteroidales bacterium OttesenSCG-928-K03]|nr:diadenylate cyclase CdaA [Odoribacter sp. OttesenSCG-928-L07]MDL2240420.1 diadenylate cyclase CdaA [Bacteroidales bacterium OttesenSCG-928-K22]MDL2242986.1 diadenylate cyclase CdaA [Bacteroidales bacterium OttesenSCG-928-K03]